MSKKIQVVLSDEVQTALDKLMKEDLATNRSGYISALIANEAKSRVRKPAGRPKNAPVVEEEEVEPDYTDDMPKNIAHFGRMIGPRELADINERQESIKDFTQPQ